MFKFKSFIIVVLVFSFFSIYSNHVSSSTTYPKIGDKLSSFEEKLGEHKPSDSSNEEVSTENEFFRGFVDENNRVWSLRLNSFPDDIKDITKAIIYTQQFLPNDTRLIESEGEKNGCNYVVDICTERYYLTFKSDKFKKIENRYYSSQNYSFKSDGKIHVMIDFSYTVGNKREKYLSYISIN